MRKLAVAGVALAALLFSLPARADDLHVGTLVATTSVNNATTATPFTLTFAARISVQCDATAYVKAVSSATGAVTTANGVKLAADQLYDVDLEANQKWIAAIASSGTANCKVFVRR